jgi:hypothetical protein
VRPEPIGVNPWPDRERLAHQSPIAAALEQPSHPPQAENPRTESQPAQYRYSV